MFECHRIVDQCRPMGQTIQEGLYFLLYYMCSLASGNFKSITAKPKSVCNPITYATRKFITENIPK